MKSKSLIATLVEGCGRGIRGWWTGAVYDQDGLRSLHNHDFMTDPSFCKAYERGCRAAGDYRWHWRVHIGLWAAFNAGKVGGDFVECGVNRGFLSSAIMEYLDWDSVGRTFYLLDTFQGLDLEYCSEADLKGGAARLNRARLRSGAYVRGVESARANFSQWKNVRIIPGSVPETLGQVDSRGVAYLHLDMNCSPPEVAALDYFWDRLLPGAVVLLDDYGYRTHDSQKHAMDEFARQKQVMIASLPTGQGLLLKPHPQVESGGGERTVFRRPERVSGRSSHDPGPALGGRRTGSSTFADRAAFHGDTNDRTRPGARLISAGAKVNAAGVDALTPLHQAAVYGDPALVRLLLDHGADIDVLDRCQYQPIHRAALSGELASLRMLVQAGAGTEARGPKGRVPRHFAVAEGNQPVMEEIVR